MMPSTAIVIDEILFSKKRFQRQQDNMASVKSKHQSCNSTAKQLMFHTMV